MKPIIDVYTFCWNEEIRLPYFLRLWSPIARTITIFDNGSSDNSENIAKSYSNVIWNTKDYDTGGILHEPTLTSLKNNCWKKSRDADLVFVGDIDEILFYKNKYNKPIWLGGQSFGAPRILNYLSYSEENSKLIEGAILTASAVGNPIRTSIKKIKNLNIPVAIIHHTRDICKYSNYKVAKKFSEQFAKINLNKTEFIEISAGSLPNDNSEICDPVGANHMFDDSRDDLADEMIKFIKNNR